MKRSARSTAGAITALVMIMVVGLSGCLSGNPSGPAGQAGEKHAGEVEWWTINLQKNYGPYIQQMIDDYTAQHPDVTITWVDVPGQDITTKLLAAIAGGQVPDAVNYTSATTGLFDDSMADLTQYFTPAELEAYAPGLRESLTDDQGRQIAIPWYNGGTSLSFYNTALLEPAGFDPDAPPASITEALQLAQRYHDATGEYGTNLMAYSTVVQANDIELLSEDGTTAAFNTEQTRALLEEFKTYFDSGAIAPGVLSSDQRNLPQTMENRQVSFLTLATSSNLLNIEKNAPEVYADVVVAAPVTGPSGTYYMPGQQVFGVPAASDNQAAAAEWLKFVTSAENQLEFCKLVAIYPSTPATLDDPFFSEITGTTPAERARAILVETFPDSRDASLGTGNDEKLRLVFDEQVRAYMSGRTTAAGALDAAEQAWNEELASS